MKCKYDVGGGVILDQVILFGAANYGKKILKFFRYQGVDNYIYAFCDNDSRKKGSLIDKKVVLSFEQAKEKKLPFIITVDKNSMAFSEIKRMLKDEGVEFYDDVLSFERLIGIDSTKYNRDYCAFHHIDDMDEYFESAEKDEALDIFWKEDTPFFRLFKQLDLRNVIELGCGHGRHVIRYYKYVNTVTLVDILEKNIEYCKKRFEGMEKIKYYKNNGVDLSELGSGEYSALFTYDAMVHFEMFDIYDYLKETYRVLENGGMALFHHSNLALNYDQAFVTPNNPGARNYMTKELFAYLAYKAGFQIVDQIVVDWSLMGMDCLTLVKKCYLTDG